jgi:hypothetical protein
VTDEWQGGHTTTRLYALVKEQVLMPEPSSNAPAVLQVYGRWR